MAREYLTTGRKLRADFLRYISRRVDHDLLNDDEAVDLSEKVNEVMDGILAALELVKVELKVDYVSRLWKTFGACLNITRSCDACGRTVRSVQQCLRIAIPLMPHYAGMELLNDLGEDISPDGDGFQCERCDYPVYHTTSRRFSELPQILIVQMQDFQNTRIPMYETRAMRTGSIPFLLNVTGLLEDEAKYSTAHFKLVAFVLSEERFNLPNRYFAYFKDAGCPQWFVQDGSSTQSVTTETVAKALEGSDTSKGRPHTLFYSK